MTTTTELPVPGWRHPHLVAVREHRDKWRTQVEGTIQPFTGIELRPEVPEEWRGIHPSDGVGEDALRRVRQRGDETRMVREVWAIARFTRRVGDVLRPVAGHPTPTDQWQTYVAAREALRAAYAALDSTPDNMWRSALLAIADAKETALKAANRWDWWASELGALDRWLLTEVGEKSHPTYAIREAAKTHGIDAVDWNTGGLYGDCTPAADEIDAIVRDAERRVAKVLDLAPVTDSQGATP